MRFFPVATRRLHCVYGCLVSLSEEWCSNVGSVALRLAVREIHRDDDVKASSTAADILAADADADDAELVVFVRSDDGGSRFRTAR